MKSLKIHVNSKQNIQEKKVLSDNDLYYKQINLELPSNNQGK